MWGWRFLISRVSGHHLIQILEPSSPLFPFSSLQAMLHLLSALVLLVQPLGNQGAEVKTLSQRSVANTCTLVMCNPTENGLPGRDGRDGREGPRGEKGDPGRAGIRGSFWWGEGRIRMWTNLNPQMLCDELGCGLLPSKEWVSPWCPCYLPNTCLFFFLMYHVFPPITQLAWFLPWDLWILLVSRMGKLLILGVNLSGPVPSVSNCSFWLNGAYVDS